MRPLSGPSRDRRPVRRRWLLSGVVAAAAILLASAWWAWSRGDDGRLTAEVTRGPISETIETTGTVVAADPTTVVAPVSGTVRAVGATAGDRVAAGDILAVFDPAPLAAAVTAAETAASGAALVASGAADAAAAAPDDAQARTRAVAAEQEATAAEDALAAARADLDAATVVAPVAGTVLAVEVETGVPAAAGTAIATINAGDRFEIAADLDEVDVPNVPLGSATSIRVDAFPGEELTGRIASVAPVGETEGGGVVFAATIALDDPTGANHALRPGMTATVALPLNPVDAATLVPEAAVETAGRRSFVRVARDGEQQQIEVVTGVRANGLVEITSGDVRPGDRVVLR